MALVDFERYQPGTETLGRIRHRLTRTAKVAAAILDILGFDSPVTSRHVTSPSFEKTNAWNCGRMSAWLQRLCRRSRFSRIKSKDMPFVALREASEPGQDERVDRPGPSRLDRLRHDRPTDTFRLMNGRARAMPSSSHHHHHHQAGVRNGQDRSADSGVQCHCVDVNEPWSAQPSIFVIQRRRQESSWSMDALKAGDGPHLQLPRVDDRDDLPCVSPRQC